LVAHGIAPPVCEAAKTAGSAARSPRANYRERARGKRAVWRESQKGLTAGDKTARIPRTSIL
jgi:hypothetical protein